MQNFLYSLFLIVAISLSCQAQNSSAHSDNSAFKLFIESLNSIPAQSPDREFSAQTELLLRRSGFPDLHPEIAEQLIKELLKKAESCRNLPMQAEIYWRAAEVIAQKSNNFALNVEVFTHRADVYIENKDYQTALDNYRRAAQILEDKSDRPSQLWLAAICAHSGDIAAYLQNFVAAQNYYEKGWQAITAPENWRDSASNSKLIIVQLLLGLSESARRAGNYRLATEKAITALNFIEENSYEAADTFWHLGKLKREQGEFIEGSAYFEKGLKILEKNSDEYSFLLKANVLNSWGLLLLEQRSPKTAQSKLETALNISRELKEIGLEGSILRNLSIAARQSGDFASTRKYAGAAAQIALETKSDELFITANGILAGLLQNEGKHAEAIKKLETSLARAEAAQNMMRIAESKWRMSESLFAVGRYENAAKLSAECLAVSRSNNWSNLVYLSATLLGRALHKQNDLLRARQAFEVAVEEIEANRQRVAGAEIEKISFMKDKAAPYQELIKIYLATNETETALKISEKLKARVLAEKLKTTVVSGALTNLSDTNLLKLPSKTTVVSFTLAEENLTAFILRPNEKLKAVNLAVTEKELREKISRWRESLINFNPNFKMKGKEIYQLLFSKIEADLAGQENLVIIPDGVLWAVPFQALVKENGQYLIENHSVRYAPSLQIFNRQEFARFASSQSPKVLAFGNSVTNLPALRQAEREVGAINKFYPQSAVFIGTAATETRLKENISGSKIVHLALHGSLDEQNPFDSALLFTPDTAADGKLKISEIIALKLSGSLVVLSSCDTSNGQVLNGEGLLSLSWAFLAAGGSSVVAAQWAVIERKTADLMIDFYDSLSGGREIAVALQTAQKTAINRPAPFNHPFYWAAFVAVGAGDAQR
jgi:CHAT domain-containing protein/Tfp pilus assembly protein PilF